MKIKTFVMAGAIVAVLSFVLVACGPVETNIEPDPLPVTEKKVPPAKVIDPNQLPTRYQKPTFIVDESGVDTALEESHEAYALKVGANITSTRGPQPLWDILKRLANLQGMSVSWASDVDQSVLVDVNITADQDFFEAIDALLRQVDYFHLVDGETIEILSTVTILSNFATWSRK